MENIETRSQLTTLLDDVKKAIEKTVIDTTAKILEQLNSKQSSSESRTNILLKNLEDQMNLLMNTHSHSKTPSPVVKSDATQHTQNSKIRNLEGTKTSSLHSMKPS